MTGPDKGTNCNWTQERIEAYLDDELPATELSRLKSHLENCPVCMTDFDLARQIQSSLRSLPVRECPDEVTDVVLDRVRSEIRSQRKQRLSQWLDRLRIRVLRPAPVLASVTVLVLLAVFVGRPVREPVYVSPEEIALAELQVKWTFAYLGEFGRKAGFMVRDEVIKSRVVEPAKSALKTAEGL